MILTQSLADIDRIYSQNDRKSMFNNFKFTCVLEARDIDTQNSFLRLLDIKKLKKRVFHQVQMALQKQ